MLNQHHQNLNSVEPHIEPLLKCVQGKKLGIYRGVVELLSITSSCEQSGGDRFRLSIPYAGQSLVWNIYFNSQCPDLGPDFVFNDETFLVDPDVDVLSKHVPSLVDWNPRNANALLNVLSELTFYYKQHQIESLQKHGERLQIEYSTLVGNTDIKMEDVEMILLPFGNKPTEARFMIRMDIDFSQLPGQNLQAQDKEILLLVVFHGPDWNRIIPQLYLAKSVEDILAGPNTSFLPPFPPDKYLMDYVPEVKKYITERINNLALSFEKKKNFISNMLVLQRGAVLEYDTVEFTFIVLLLEHRDFHFLVHCRLPADFPKYKPIITLQSIYLMTSQGKLYAETIDDYPYSPRWEPKMMITKLLSCIVENEIPKFQTNSMKNSCRF